MIPKVQIDKTDGNLNVAADTERVLAIIGVAGAGAFDTPQAFTSKNDLIAEHPTGPLAEAAAYMIARGVPVVCIRANPATAAAYSSLTKAITGTADATAGATSPHGDYDVRVEILTGGTLGSAGIVYRYTLDDAVNWSDPIALGTSLTLTCDSGVSFTLADSGETLVAGDTWKCTTTRPKITSTDLTDSFNALKDYSGEWLRALVLEESDATLLAACDTFAKSFHADGKFPEVITSLRYRNLATSETRGAYQTALAAVVADVQSTEVSAAADQCEVISEISGRRYRMPSCVPYAARTMIIDDSQDAAAKADGALPGVFLRSADNSRQYHDERRFPGIDALGVTTLRTFGGRPVSPGAYINNARLLSGAGSDFRYFQHSALLNRAIEQTFQLLEPKLSMGVRVNNTTGRIDEDQAKALEETVSGELRTSFSDPGRCSGIAMTLSRTDNVLSTDSLSFDVAMQPLAYVKKFLGKAGLVRKLKVAAA